MSLSTGSRQILAEPLATAVQIDERASPVLDGVDTSPAPTVRAPASWRGTAARRAGTSVPGTSVSQTTHRRRLTAPLMDFVSALRGAISAFGQGQVGTRRELTFRQIGEIQASLEASLERSPAEATRMLYIGDLSPHSGVVDLLSCLIAWADRHRDTPVDICWAGSGDLQGVLRAQAKPPNMTQSFTTLDDAEALADLAAARGILVVPNSGSVDILPIARAMAAGLPVLGSARCSEVRMVVTSTALGWLFNPLSPAEMSSAIDAALSTSPAALAEMRAAARRRLRVLCDEWLGANGDAGLRRNSIEYATSGPV